MSLELSDVRSWKKVYENDLDNIIIELKEAVKTPSVIVLEGVVGAGKTTFTKKFIDQKSSTTSPSYSIINEVDNIVHADFYRLENRDEIIHLEIPLYLEGKDFFLIEWGREYLNDLVREVGEGFNFYLLEITMNELKSAEEFPSRNFFFKQIKI
ncbi:tRNA (adenosine(37)-N6)-threonylcarbamoyltransferase complex ATPase subunit type 1 TsaE [Bacteriovorax sp. Seq25_V]|uniref:tRNA (adenosine(37)-N6)-threonylcarbamoyltransferase complex ATPase subunit type 1 TsaE n=1 Tax=Bacteriovorax sp. Seq25_V TaxID=1201288 RepID=UPI00038A2B10|nr:tRNA (adenosine(37)-N6)-threonylcarbamoyltransferase complex ATPase subunit type 1 TsaE [Bacteriovorax sp. Seq25_V]EQC46040.1 tRNA threonylcarbamoyl adenosine modification protein YjeE [Bacteriovorax sp. Seq25_V]